MALLHPSAYDILCVCDKHGTLKGMLISYGSGSAAGSDIRRRNQSPPAKSGYHGLIIFGYLLGPGVILPGFFSP